MALDLFKVREGLSIEDKVNFIPVVANPSVAGLAAPKSSLAFFDAEGKFFYKSGDADNDWKQGASISDINDAVATLATGLKWRNEIVYAATSSAAPAQGDAVVWPLADDEGATIAAPATGQYVLFGIGGTAKLGKVTASGTWNYSGFSAIGSGDMFLVQNMVSDPDGQEGQAIVTIAPDSSVIKIADIDFSTAVGISITSDYAPSTGNLSQTDSVQSALQKLDGNSSAMETAVGVSRADTNLGAFSGGQGATSIFGSDETVKSALSKVGNEIGVGVSGQQSRANNHPISDQPVNENVKALDAAIGSDADITPVSRSIGQVASTNNLSKNLDALDQAIGANAVPQSRSTSSMIAGNSVNQNLTQVDAAIGSDADITSTNFISTGNNVAKNLSSLDAGISGLVERESKVNLNSGSQVVLATLSASDNKAVKFEIEATNGSSSYGLEVKAVHNGSDTDYNQYGMVRIGDKLLQNVTVALSGVGASQVIQLKADVQTSGTNVRVLKIKG